MHSSHEFAQGSCACVTCWGGGGGRALFRKGLGQWVPRTKGATSWAQDLGKAAGQVVAPKAAEEVSHHPDAPKGFL